MGEGVPRSAAMTVDDGVGGDEPGRTIAQPSPSAGSDPSVTIEAARPSPSGTNHAGSMGTTRSPDGATVMTAGSSAVRGPTAPTLAAAIPSGAAPEPRKSPGHPGLRDPRRAGPRRDGRRLPGARAEPQPDLRPEDDPGRAHAGPEAVIRFLAGGRGRRPAAPSQHRRRSTTSARPTACRTSSWSTSRAAAWPTRAAASPWPPRRAAAMVEALARGVRRGAPPRDRPSRPEAGQRPARRRRHAEDHRLRPGQEPGGRRRPDARPTRSSARPATWRRSRPRARTGRSGRRPTSTRSARSSTSC